MGKLVHEQAKVKGHSIVAVIDSKTRMSDPSTIQSISLCDVCIDFSTPHAVLENVKTLASLKKNMVVGTTGWNDDSEEIQHIVNTSAIGFLHAPNFSLGIALFLKVIEQTAALMAPFGQYEVAGTEIHHSTKLDSPSGTAKAIECRLNHHKQHSPVAFSSIRVGHVPGIHSVMYDSPADTITLTHTARSREGFAQGAITAAEWLEGKKGMYTLDDLLRGTLS
jgi:4-hydroxy-tetrahydrodipicolinate reductase